MVISTNFGSYFIVFSNIGLNFVLFFVLFVLLSFELYNFSPCISQNFIILQKKKKKTLKEN